MHLNEQTQSWFSYKSGQMTIIRPFVHAISYFCFCPLPDQLLDKNVKVSKNEILLQREADRHFGTIIWHSWVVQCPEALSNNDNKTKNLALKLESQTNMHLAPHTTVSIYANCWTPGSLAKLRPQVRVAKDSKQPNEREHFAGEQLVDGGWWLTDGRLQLSSGDRRFAVAVVFSPEPTGQHGRSASTQAFMVQSSLVSLVA